MTGIPVHFLGLDLNFVLFNFVYCTICSPVLCGHIIIIIIVIIILFIERHIQQAVRGALQHSIAVLSVIINIQVNYFLKTRSRRSFPR